jgi:hypothetical protein
VEKLRQQTSTRPIEVDVKSTCRALTSNGQEQAQISTSASLDLFLRHVAEISASRQETLRDIARALEEEDFDAVVRHARMLVGV